MEFTVELRYQSGSQTVLSIDADSADQALEEVRDQRRLLVGVHISAPSQRPNGADDRNEPTTREAVHTHRRIPVQHRPSRRRR